MTANVVGFSLLLLGLLLVLGKWIRVSTPILQDLFLPSSLIAGFFALLLGPEVLGRFFTIIPDKSLQVWRVLPGLMINVVFAALFIGKRLPNIKTVWKLAGPQVVMGYCISFGQYVVGLLLVIFLLTPVFDIDPTAGALIEVAFVGGHGTAAGMASTFQEIGFPEGADLALGLATVGVLGGVIIGMFLINWGIRRKKLVNEIKIQTRDEIEKKGINELDTREPAGYLSTRLESIEPLSLHFGYIAIAILLGYGILQGLVRLEEVLWGARTGVYLIRYVPLFPLAMVGGMIVQGILDKIDPYNTVDRQMINRIQGLALDVLIVSALATLSLTVIGENLIPFLLLSLVGILWTVFCFVFLAPKMLPDYWFERGIGDFGQSMGVTATGLLLMRVADPENKTPALESFGYKQILFEPFVGGGLFTAASVPLIYQFGAVPILIFTGIIAFGSLIFGLFITGKKNK
ncbi:sodium/glutamate symporter [Anaerobranca gottschalkii]|uniref:Glutamate:Na+ symporter, ESS family n=1 Tax=Anaerobranca gottschalkii DSM 13577 TaxID=1120990 RepID=A0A1I0A9X8_9FIRM|nr:sodium/glutamate symporter [Anaerobranca gottschalkii]SES90495.1 glutamate:Na+ symporter, ESS family [Anaerobranca gottschalkii DSM 13577]